MNILLIIDMQNAWLAKPSKPCLDTDVIVKRINHAARHIREQGGRVIHIQHAADDAPVGSRAWDILAALDVKDGDGTVDKLACDAFADTDLAHQLEGIGNDTLYISGFATEFCVDTTVRAAGSRGMNVVVLSDAHTTSDRPHLNAASIIAHHNWIWSNMAMARDASLAVKTTAAAFPAERN